MTQLVATYGYPLFASILFAAAAGVPLPVPVAALIVGLGALSGRPGGPDLAVLALCGVSATSAGHSVDYWLGRAGSPLIMRWLVRLERRLGGPLTGSGGATRQPAMLTLIFVTRCLLTALASPMSAAAGAMRLSFSAFLSVELAGQVVYVGVLLALGRLAGPALPRITAVSPITWLGAAAVLIALALGARTLPAAARRLAHRPA